MLHPQVVDQIRERAESNWDNATCILVDEYRSLLREVEELKQRKRREIPNINDISRVVRFGWNNGVFVEKTHDCFPAAINISVRYSGLFSGLKPTRLFQLNQMRGGGYQMWTLPEYRNEDRARFLAITRKRHAEAEVKKMRRWVADLQSGMYVNCVFCSHRYGPADSTPVSMADTLKQHIERCPDHPLSDMKAQRDLLLKIVCNANRAFRFASLLDNFKRKWPTVWSRTFMMREQQGVQKC